MVRTRLFKFSILVVTLSLFVFFLKIPPSQSAEVRGITDKSIKVGIGTVLSGPIGTYIGRGWAAGAVAALKEVNDKGGVNGRTFEWLIEDHGYQGPRALTMAKKLVERDNVFMLFVLGSPTNAVLFEYIDKMNVPLLPGSESSFMFTPPKKYVFSVAPPYKYQAAALMDYLADQEKGKKPKVAILYQDDEYGQDCLNGALKGAEYHGIQVVDKEAFKRDSVDFSAELIRVKSANPDYILVGTTTQPAGVIVKQSYELGLKKKVWSICGPGFDRDTIRVAGAEAAKAMDWTGVRSAVTWEDPEAPGVKAMIEAAKKYEPQSFEEKNEYFSLMYAATKVFIEGLRLAGRDLNPESFVKGMESLRNFQTGIYPPATFGPGIRSSGIAARIFKADADSVTLKVISDWIEPKGFADEIAARKKALGQ